MALKAAEDSLFDSNRSIANNWLNEKIKLVYVITFGGGGQRVSVSYLYPFLIKNK